MVYQDVNKALVEVMKIRRDAYRMKAKERVKSLVAWVRQWAELRNDFVSSANC